MPLRGTVQNCDAEFRFECPKQWDLLQITGDDKVRHCEKCSRDVFLCETVDEAQVQAQSGRCVALPVDAAVLFPRKHRIGDLIIRDKLITLDELRQAQALANRSTPDTRTPDELSLLSKAFGVPAINLEDGSFSIGPEVATLIPKELAVRANVVPLNAGENWIVVAMSNPRDYATIDEVKVLTERNVDVVVASPKGIQSALQKSYFVAGVAT